MSDTPSRSPAALAQRAYELRAEGKSYREIGRILHVDNAQQLLTQVGAGDPLPDPVVVERDTPIWFYREERFG